MKQEFSPPEWVPREAWNEWLMVRKKKRAPLTEYALKLAVKHLDELRRKGYTPQAVLDNCILQGWQGIWPPRDGEKKIAEAQIGGGPSVERSACSAKWHAYLQIKGVKWCSKCEKVFEVENGTRKHPAAEAPAARI